MLAALTRVFHPRCNPFPVAVRAFSLKTMVQTRSAKASLSHEERTATEPRDNSLYPVILDRVTPVNDRIRTLRFSLKDRGSINVSSETLSNSPALIR